MSSSGPDPAPAADPAARLWLLWQQGRRPELAAFLAGAGGLSPTQLLAVLRIDQEQRWRHGERSPPKSTCGAPGLEDDADGPVVLIYAEFLLHEALGSPPDPEEFQRRFPRHAGRLRLQVELHRLLAASRP